MVSVAKSVVTMIADAILKIKTPGNVFNQDYVRIFELLSMNSAYKFVFSSVTFLIEDMCLNLKNLHPLCNYT